jgi:O-antigen/teichoic acid export membrane protein
MSGTFMRPFDRETARNILSRHRPAGFGRWMSKGFWAVTDQGLFAASNFVLNVMLARWLTPQGYGAITVALTAFLLIETLHRALLTDPMLVFGPGRYEERSPEYVSVLLYGHLGFSALGVLALLIAGLGFDLWGSGSISSALLALAFAVPFILFVWLMRRACYIHLESRLAASGSALYSLLLLLMTYVVLFRYGWVSAYTVFGAMGLVGLVVGIYLAARLRVRWFTAPSSGLAREALKAHWGYGRWMLASNVVNFVPYNIYFLLLPAWGSLAATATLKALWNLMLPAMHVNTALTALLVPALVQVRGRREFKRRTGLFLGLLALGSTAYWILLGLFHNPVVAWLYNGRYSDYAYLLWLLGLLPIIMGSAGVLAAVLRAHERPDQVFWAYAISAASTLTLGAVLTVTQGVTGAVLGFLVSFLTALGAMAWLCLKFVGRG